MSRESSRCTYTLISPGHLDVHANTLVFKEHIWGTYIVESFIETFKNLRHGITFWIYALGSPFSQKYGSLLLNNEHMPRTWRKYWFVLWIFNCNRERFSMLIDWLFTPFGDVFGVQHQHFTCCLINIQMF
jgi:hypothetical protein